MVKKVFKYGTGFKIPEGAIYLNTQVEEIYKEIEGIGQKVRLVWHYFLVEVDE